MPGNRRQSAREARRATARAAAKIARAELNPFEVAHENDQLKAMIRGYDVIMRAMVRRSPDKRIAFPLQELMDLPNTVRLNVETLEDGTRVLTEVMR